MAGASEFVTFLSEAKQIHLPTLRFVLRSVVTESNYDEHCSEGDRLLRLVGPAMLWSEPLRTEFSARPSNIRCFPVETNLWRNGR